MNRSCVLLLAALAVPAVAAPSVGSLIEAAARAQVERQLGLSELQVDLEVVTPRPAPPCSRPLSVEPLDTRQIARMRFVARCPIAGGAKVEYVVRAKASAMVAVAAAPLAANEVLSDASITLERRDVTFILDAIGSPELAVGRTSRRSLRAGDVLRAGQLAAPVLVKRGDQVLMVARHEAVEVSTTGEALDAGSRGSIVRVRNPSSGQVVRMRVTAAGTVEPMDLARITP